MNNTFRDDLFKNKVAVVTGGTSGIGEATAKILAELGAKVYAVGLEANQLDVQKALSIQPIELDVTDERKVESFFETLDQLDILINGAAASLPNEYNLSEFKKVIDINTNALFHFCILAQPLLAQSDIGTIINISSLNSIFASDMAPAYSASKGAVNLITKSLAIKYAEDGIRVNAIAPGYTETKMMAEMPKEFIEEGINRTPMKRLGTADELGQAITFLATPAASWLTGVVLPVDGGYSLK